MDKTGEDENGLYLGKSEKRWPNFFERLSQFISICHLHSWKIIVIHYVVVSLQMKVSLCQFGVLNS